MEITDKERLAKLEAKMENVSKNISELFLKLDSFYNKLEIILYDHKQLFNNHVDSESKNNESIRINCEKRLERERVLVVNKDNEIEDKIKNIENQIRPLIIIMDIFRYPKLIIILLIFIYLSLLFSDRLIDVIIGGFIK